MVISEMIDIRKNNPQIIKQIKEVADKELLISLPLEIKFIIRIPNTIRTIKVPKSPPSPPQADGIQSI
jgi:hypothetical protein